MKPSEAPDALEAFLKYTQAFQTLDPAAPVSHFHQPALMATPEGIRVLSTASDVAEAYQRLMRMLQGTDYAHSDFVNLTSRRLSETLAIVSGGCIWKKKNGEDMQRFGITYTFTLSKGGWKILSALIHDPAGYT